MKLLTAKTALKYQTADEYVEWVKARPERYHYKSSIVKPIDDIDKNAPKAMAFVSEGRWVADCPSGCGAAMYVEPDMPFMCGFCFNIELKGRWRLVEWPSDSEIANIETQLEKRPIHRQRNWKTPEMATDLEKENQERGL